MSSNLHYRGSFLIIPLFWGQINFKRTKDEVFSERYGYTKTLRVMGISITWRRYQ